ncbi:MAG: hypothetical protein QXU98_08665 [Candidatus Parvarchaeota archaeon]
MLNLLPLMKGWTYTIKTLNQPIITKNKVTTIIGKSDSTGWFIAGSAITTDPQIDLKFYVNGQDVITASPSLFYVFGGRNQIGVPFTFSYGQYVPGSSYQVYGFGLYNTNGYPYNGEIKVTLETQLDEIYIADYEVIMLEITDKKAFIESYKSLHRTDSKVLAQLLTEEGMGD